MIDNQAEEILSEVREGGYIYVENSTMLWFPEYYEEGVENICQDIV